MKVIVKAVAGSHLFGTNTPSSDKDFKGVFIPSAREILLGDYPDTITQKTNNSGLKNESTDTDIELYSLRKFLKMCIKGDTASLELLFSPDSAIIESTKEWTLIKSHTQKLISRSITGVLGYARHQAAKYGAKGSRLGELSNLNDKLKELSKTQGFNKISTVFDELKDSIKSYNYIRAIKMQNPAKKVEEVDGIEILGAKFDSHTSITTLSKWCSDKFKEYGHRAREAKNNNGVDWKALSHSARCSIQAKELLSTGKITLPHTGENLKLLMDIKQGNYDFSKVDILLDDLLKEVEDLAETSSLPDKVDEEFTKDLLASIYRAVIFVDLLKP